MFFKILSVDDSPIIANHIKCLCEELKNCVLVGQAFSLEEAKNLIEKKKPNVVLLDIFLEEENGLDLLVYLNKFHPEIIVVILSNQSDLFYKNKCRALGAHCFLDKSYEFDKIPDILYKIAENKNILS